jgi:hypothetical protein
MQQEPKTGLMPTPSAKTLLAYFQYSLRFLSVKEGLGAIQSSTRGARVSCAFQNPAEAESRLFQHFYSNGFRCSLGVRYQV